MDNHTDLLISYVMYALLIVQIRCTALLITCGPGSYASAGICEARTRAFHSLNPIKTSEQIDLESHYLCA